MSRFELDYGSMSALKDCLTCKDNALQVCLSQNRPRMVQ